MNLQFFNGLEMRVDYELPKTPKLKLSESAPVTDKFRFDFNMWLANRFGLKTQAIRVGNVIYVSPETYRELKNQNQNTYQETGFKQ
jgi:hypothetical protein